MPVFINGSTGVSGVDGTAATPAVQGTDTNTGMFFPAADQIAFAEGGTEVMRIDASGNVGIGTSSPGERLVVQGNSVNVLAQIRNSSTVNSTSKTTAVQFVGTDTVGTAKETGTIFVVPGDNNYVSSAMLFNTRAGDTVAERMRIDASGNLQFNSGYGSVATAFGCRAWVNFNGTGTVAIRASGNVSSITDNNTGDYTVNFTTAMPDINYSAPISFSGENGARNGMTDIVCATGAASARTTSAIRIATSQAGISTNDCSFVNVAVFR